jgi:hypothetical protein
VEDLAPLPEGRSNQGIVQREAAGTKGQPRATGYEPHDRRRDARSRLERAGRNVEQPRDLGPLLRHYREQTVDTAARGGRQPERHFLLEHEHEPGDACGLVERPPQNVRGRVERQVPYDHEGTTCTLRTRRPVEVRRVPLPHLQPIWARYHLRKIPGQLGVQFQRDDTSDALREWTGKSTRPRADLHDPVLRSDVQSSQYLVPYPQVHEEVLPE